MLNKEQIAHNEQAIAKLHELTFAAFNEAKRLHADNVLYNGDNAYIGIVCMRLSNAVDDITDAITDG